MIQRWGRAGRGSQLVDGGLKDHRLEPIVGALSAAFASFYLLGHSWVESLVVAVLSFVLCSTVMVGLGQIVLRRARKADQS